MAKRAPFHSVKGTAYHDNTRCTEGNNIEPRNRRAGTGGLPKCQRCKALG